MGDFFGAIVGGLIAIFVALWLIQAFPGFFITLAIIVGGFFAVRYYIRESKAEAARLAQEAAQKLAEEQRQTAERLAAEKRKADEQASCAMRIQSACRDSLAAYENIPKSLMTAEELLVTADSEFQEGAFSPFWDSVERAMSQLGAVDSSIRLIADRSSQYKALTVSYLGAPPPFPVDPDSARRLGTANDTAAHLQLIVRKAQRNFQFATIYEQRKTNTLLIAGFTNLADAIHGVGAQLEESVNLLGDRIDDLSSSMAEQNERLVDAVQDVSIAMDGVSSTIKEADEKARAATADQADRQDKANKMLDNIQRRRVPPKFAEN